jgi:hypothetical protein
MTAYIPDSRIQALPILPIGDEQSDVDIYWRDLAIETCNIKKWHWCCKDILIKSFGTTKIEKFTINFRTLRNLLETLCLTNYSSSDYLIQIEEQSIDMSTIFYASETISKYPISDKTDGKIRKYITSDEKQYVLSFIERLDIYLQYLETNIDKIPVYIGKPIQTMVLLDKRPKIIKSIETIKKKCDKMIQFINTLNI